jgi:hypothetical protein
MKLSLAPITCTMILLALLTFPSAASAGPKLGIDVDLSVPVSMNGVKVGVGGALRGGYDIDLAIVHVMPEVGLGLNKLTGDVGPLVFRGFLGGRLGIGALVRLDVFGHIGYANVSYTDRSTGGGRDGYGTPVFDVGVALDVTALPDLDLGIHASYNAAFGKTGTADAPQSPQWLGLGAHIAFGF